MNYRRFFSRFSIALLALASAGCERDDICPENTPGTPSAKVDFRVYDQAGLPVEYAQQGVRFYGLEGDERLGEIAMSEGAVSLQLPVDFEAEESRYLIERAGEVDTLVLHYTPELEFISKACGFRFTFSGVTVNCTTEGPVSAFDRDIEASPADGLLFDSRQTAATIYFRTEEPLP